MFPLGFLFQKSAVPLIPVVWETVNVLSACNSLMPIANRRVHTKNLSRTVCHQEDTKSLFNLYFVQVDHFPQRTVRNNILE